MRLLLLQNDPVFGETAKNLETARAALAGAQAELIVLPELFASGYQFASMDEVRALAEPVEGPTVAMLEALARESGATVVAGFPERARDGTIYNSAAIVLPSGFLTTYRKLHLFFEERTWFTPGPALSPVVRTPQGLRVGVMICFDWRFPEVSRFLALEEADVIAHPSNLVRPHCPDGMVLRCLENLVFAATANRVGEEARGGRPPLRYIGRTQVVSPKGERLGALGSTEPGLLSVAIDPALARSKAVTGIEDLFAARRTDVLALAPKRSRAARRFAILRHEPEGGGAAHLDLLLERDGLLLAWRLPDGPGLAPGLAAERGFDHRARFLDFEGDLGGGRGSVRALRRGRYVPTEERVDLVSFEVEGGGRWALRRTDAARDLWRVEAG